LQDAQRIAREHTHQEMDGEHLLLALPGQAEPHAGIAAAFAAVSKHPCRAARHFL
jgi:ATP-dependent Clp protease ATP-binding subunit ClpA